MITSKTPITVVDDIVRDPSDHRAVLSTRRRRRRLEDDQLNVETLMYHSGLRRKYFAAKQVRRRPAFS